MQRFFQQFLKNTKIVAVFITTVFVIVALFGINSGMNMRQDGSMTGCMFDQSMDCPMGYTEHISQWQQTFIAVQNTNNDILLSIILLLMGAGMILSFLRYRNYDFESHFDVSKIHKERNGLAKLFDYVLRALSDGRLNPKIYDSTYIR